VYSYTINITGFEMIFNFNFSLLRILVFSLL